MKADAIIQARMGATRLPGKVLLKVLDKTMLEYVIERVKKAGGVKNVVVATTTKDDDLKIVELAGSLGVNTYRGSEEDVLDRFYRAAKLYKLEHIVRITADCPLIDPEVIDKIVKCYFSSGADYCGNAVDRTFPDGEDVEVFSLVALRDAWKNASLSSEREHVTPYIRKNSDKFKLVDFKNDIDLSAKRWSLDEREDFEFIKRILEALYPANPDFHMEDVLRFIQSNAGLEDINKNILINEGYSKSLKEDRTLDISASED